MRFERQLRAEASLVIGVPDATLLDSFCGWNKAAQMLLHPGALPQVDVSNVLTSNPDAGEIQGWQEGFMFEHLNFSRACQASDQGPGGAMRWWTDTTPMGKVGTGTAVNGSINSTKGPWFLPPVTGGLAGYYRCRAKFESTVDADTIMTFGLQNDTTLTARNGDADFGGAGAPGASGSRLEMSIGIVGSLSTTKIIFRYDGLNYTGTKLDLIDVDSAWHTYRLWWFGDGVVHISVDNVLKSGAGITPASPLTNLVRQYIAITNGDTSANRSMLSGYTFVACAAGDSKAA